MKSLAVVEWRNGPSMLYRFESNQEITIERVARWLTDAEGFSEDRDSVTLFMEEDCFIDLDEKTQEGEKQ